MMALASGKLEKQPFSEEVVEKTRAFVADQVGVPEAERGVASGQCFRLGILSQLLRALDGPGWKFVGEVASGVPLGVDVVMPRTPAVYDPKLKWKLDDVDLHPEAEVENYVSAKGFESQLQEAFEKEAELGWMREITDDDAKRIYGDRLAVATLKVVKEKAKFRVVHDGTHGVAVNNRIRAWR